MGINDLPFKKTLKKRLTLIPYRVILLEVSERKQPKVRKQVKWNTGTRVQKTKKGKGRPKTKKEPPIVQYVNKNDEIQSEDDSDVSQVIINKPKKEKLSAKDLKMLELQEKIV